MGQRSKRDAIKRRHQRLRQKISGTSERPRLCICKSSRHIYAQLIDDRAGRSLASLTTDVKANKSESKTFCNQTWAKKIGEQMGEKASELGIKAVVFDRGGHQYHGVVRVFAEAAREKGLQF